MRNAPTEKIEIDFYSDILCIWAYISGRRVQQLAETFGERINIRTRLCSVYSDVPERVGKGWKDRGGYEGYARHIQDLAKEFPHIVVADSAWSHVRPTSSAPAHLFLRAIHLTEAQSTGQDPDSIPFLQRSITRAYWLLQRAFFQQGRDIGDWRVLSEIAEETGHNPDSIWAPETQARAAAALARDFDLSRKQNVEGSPTLILNSGRQRLFGNVGYRLLQANVEELLRHPSADQASWC